MSDSILKVGRTIMSIAQDLVDRYEDLQRVYQESAKVSKR